MQNGDSTEQADLYLHGVSAMLYGQKEQCGAADC